MTEELKPCPFCGGVDEALSEYFLRAGDLPVWGVECRCGAERASDASEAEARTLWNTRSPAPSNEVASREVSEDGWADKANDLTVELTEAMIRELDVDEDDPRLGSWGKIADAKIEAALRLAASPPARPAVVSNPCCDQMRSGIWVNDKFDSPFCPVHTLPAQDEVVSALVERLQKLMANTDRNELVRLSRSTLESVCDALAKAQGLTDTQGEMK